MHNPETRQVRKSRAIKARGGDEAQSSHTVAQATRFRLFSLV